mgnify:CR=1 FL=1
MENKPDQVPVFRARPVDERKTIVVRKEEKILHPSIIPDNILKDEFLNSLISESLPKNYNFEIAKTIWKIVQNESKRVMLQLPEGLIRFGTVLIDIFTGYFLQNGREDVKFILMGDLTYGACCIDDYLATSLGCDLIVHYAHSCLVPINKLMDSVKYLYIFLDIKFELTHVLNCIRHNFQPDVHKIALASTIQFVSSIHDLARQLRDSGYTITLPQSRPLSSGEVLGCTAPKLDPCVNTIVFICDGRFHLEALMISNPEIKAYRYDPYSRKLTHETYAFDEMYKQRTSAINRALEVMGKGGRFGLVLGTLGRQGNENLFDRLVQRLKSTTDCDIIKVLMPEVVQDRLELFDSVDVWVQVACPRLSIDWGSFFHTPLLNPFEFAQCFKAFVKGEHALSVTRGKNYPMDFYAKNSSGDHTPNHSCQSNPNCECSA